MEDLEIQEEKKQWMKRYKKNLACIVRLEEKLTLLDDRLTSVKSPSLSGMPRGGTPVTSDDLIADKMELEERIRRLKEKGKVIKKEILNAIDDLSDPRFSGVLEAYFIDDLSFSEIAHDLNYSEKSVIRIYSQGIRALDLPLTREKNAV